MASSPERSGITPGPQTIGAEDQQLTAVDVAGGRLPSFEPTPAAPAVPLRELRIALVCYGGVSLAIYMHGITKELEKLVAASVAYQRDQARHPFAATDTAGSYWAVLKRLEDETQVRTKVVVDIVSGTSAGGINGVFLAAAIARNRSQEPLCAMWMKNGDIKRLLRGREGARMIFKAPRAVRSVVGRQPVLDGARISKWLREALGKMSPADPPIVPGVDSLLGPDERVQLFVPITDFYGYDVRIPADDPAWVQDRTHRHIMQFVHDPRSPELDQLSSRWDDALAFTARATSSFPAAFPPLSIADYEASVPTPAFDAAQRSTLFASYALSNDASPAKTHFVDGGVLDNKPFASTIAAITLRPAASEVDRRMIYVEPDPSTESGGAPDGQVPSLLQTIIGGYAGIPRQEPILGDLTDLAVRNANVGRIRDVIETSFEPMRRRVLGHIEADGYDPGAGLDATQLTGWRSTLTAQAAEGAGFAYPTYLRLRIRAVVDDFAMLIARRHDYPPTSAHALFVAGVLRAQADAQGLFERSDTGTDAQHALVDTLDLAHQERHIRFLIAALNWWYNPGDEDRAPRRAQLDEAKSTLYGALGRVQDLAELLTRDEDIRARADGLFGLVALRGALDAGAGAFLAAHGDELSELQQRVAATVGPALAELPAALDAEIAEITSTWTAWARSELLTRHLGFSYWDILIYPIEAVSGVHERDHVEVMRISPQEARVLATAEEKNLKGRTLGHFGAFFSREGRENDYLWGRLDGSERLLALLLTPPGASVGRLRGAAHDADPTVTRRRADFEADARATARVIVSSERATLKEIPDRLDGVDARARTNRPG